MIRHRQESAPLPPGVEAKIRDRVASLPLSASSNDCHAATHGIMNELDSVDVALYVRICEAIVAGLASRTKASSPHSRLTATVGHRRRFFTSIAATAAAMQRIEDSAPVFETQPSTELSPVPIQLPDGQLAFGGFV